MHAKAFSFAAVKVISCKKLIYLTILSTWSVVLCPILRKLADAALNRLAGDGWSSTSSLSNGAGSQKSMTLAIRHHLRCRFHWSTKSVPELAGRVHPEGHLLAFRFGPASC